MHYRPEIDGLRAIAVLPVILYHAGYDAFAGGYVGVDVFFVISGYLITSIIDRNIQAGQFSLAGFYARRVRRILPALWLVALACIPFALVLMTPQHLANFAESLLSLGVFASNIYFWQQSGYFSPAAELQPLLHTWSLAVEEQFYLLFPLLMLLLLPRSRRFTIGVIALGCVVSFGFAIFAAQAFPYANFFLLPSRGFELGAGVLIALVLRGRIVGGPILRSAGAGLGLALIAVAIVRFDTTTPFPGLAALLPVIGTSLIIVFAGRGDAIGWLLGRRPLVLIGLISYSAYLWHQPLFVFARLHQFGGGGAPNYALLIGLTFGLAWLSWRYVETPFRNAGVVSRRRAIPVLAGLTLLAAGFGAIAVTTQGFAAQNTSPHVAALTATAVYSPKRNECHTRGRNYRAPDQACRYFVENPAWATFGDSHTIELGYALARHLEPYGEGIRHYSFSNCGPRYRRSDTGNDRDHCARWSDEAVDYIASDDTITTVVVTYRIHAYLFGDHARDFPDLPDTGSASQREATWRSYRETIAAFRMAGKRVVVVLQAPELPAPVSYMLRREVNSSGSIEGIPRLWWDARRAFVMARLDDLAPGVIIIDPTELICDERICRASEGDTFLYFDQNHLSVAGMDKIALAILAAAEISPAPR